jgi:hypothetical protein
MFRGTGADRTVIATSVVDNSLDSGPYVNVELHSNIGNAFDGGCGCKSL